MDTETFDLNLGKQKKIQILSSLEKKEIFKKAKEIAKELALLSHDKTCTADEVQFSLISRGYSPRDLGNAAGAIFNKKDWMFTGEWKPSARVSNHAHMNRVWRLK